ncbi:putative cation transporter [Elusimicrobium posterum]|uniref:DUF1646 family protein n=1 Tax=Elusimicrobium posterum TaxID=3116653 RepID=UPI003C7191E1
MVDILLVILILLVFVLPLTISKVEENLEPFLLVCGIAAVTITSTWSKDLVIHAFEEPLHISAAVLVVGIIFKRYHLVIHKVVDKAVDTIGMRWTLFSVVIVLGFTSSIITAIVAALILSEVATVLCIRREDRIKLVVYSCFAISVGAILTPIGEPLATIILSKLSGAPHFADTSFVFRLLWPYIFSIILIMAVLAYRIVGKETVTACERAVAFHSFKDIILRTLKVYVFVMGLIFLGDGLKPLAYKTIYKLSDSVLYWVNIVSISLDNATLAAVEIVPEMSEATLEYLLVSLIIGGGMLIPANIPNIISASKLEIKSKEWAKIGMPLGLILMVIYFVFLKIFVG